MITRILVGVSDSTGEGSREIFVVDDFDRVLNIPVPLEQPSSALAARQSLTLRKTDGGRIFLQPNTITSIEEVEEES